MLHDINGLVMLKLTIYFLYFYDTVCVVKRLLVSTTCFIVLLQLVKALLAVCCMLNKSMYQTNSVVILLQIHLRRPVCFPNIIETERHLTKLLQK